METPADQWEQRYYKAIEQYGADERRWQRVYTLLRRLVQRLLLVGGSDHDDRVRHLLGQVRDSVGEHADESSLSAAVSALSQAVLDLGAGAPRTVAADPAGTPIVGALLIRILERLALVPELADTAWQLRAAIAGSTPDALPQHAEELADLINRQCALLIADKNRIESLLDHVGEYLDEHERYLDHQQDELRTSHHARLDLQDRIGATVRSMHDEARDATRLGALRTCVSSSVATLEGQLRAFQQSEERRERAWQLRTEQMMARIHALERATEALQQSLHDQRREAIIDKLTGIANRDAFEDRINEACRRLKRSGLTACLLVLDIDCFRDVNDRYGHVTGDRALRAIAGQLHSMLRETDFLARHGGEEFVVLLEALDGHDALKVAEKLRTRIASLRFGVREREVRITLSAGVTELQPEDTPHSAFDRADRALRTAKNEGRNRCVLA